MDLIGVYKHNYDSFINRYETPIEFKVKKEVIFPNDFNNLLESGERHDMIVRVGDETTGQEFKLHSQIIGARSEYI
ncbi:unnamed protein product [Rhizophagus irregularis]|nr:unnamed protein product [Rhizophagus irregularis]